jgi:hypothetical protein
MINVRERDFGYLDRLDVILLDEALRLSLEFVQLPISIQDVHALLNLWVTYYRDLAKYPLIRLLLLLFHVLILIQLSLKLRHVVDVQNHILIVHLLVFGPQHGLDVHFHLGGVQLRPRPISPIVDKCEGFFLIFLRNWVLLVR